MGTAAKPDSTASATLLGSSKPADDGKPVDDGKPAGDGKPAADGTAASVVPEKYTLELPDESPFDASFVEQFSAKAKEGKLTQEQAKTVFDYVHQQIGDRMSAAQQAELKGGKSYESRVKQWAKEAANDKEIGGVHWNENIGLAQRVAAQFFDSDVLDFLENTGYGSHPGIVKALVKIGKAMGEDTLVKAPGTAEAKKEKTASQSLYPSHYDDKGKPK
jgi:hypothetical protein